MTDASALSCSCCGRPYPRRKLHALGDEPAYICRRCGFWLVTQWRGDAVAEQQDAPPASDVTVEPVATVDLGRELPGMDGRQLRMRKVTMAPGAVFGPVHDHVGRPGTVYIMQGTITDHRDGISTEYGPGVGWPEDHTTVHWLENRGTLPAVEISVDIVAVP